MALELIGLQWIIFILLTVCKVRSIQDIGTFDMFNNTKFDCALDINGTKWNMECSSDNFDFDSKSKFITSKLHGILNIDKPITLKDILHSTSFKDSEFYSCDSEWRYFILIDPSALSSNCIKIQGFKKIVFSLNESYLIKIKISNVKNPDNVLNILSDCIQLKDLSIFQNNISNMTSLSIHSNNTIKILNLKNNSIYTIADGLFNKLHYLEFLDLSLNLLKSINTNLFSGITNITHLDLSHNIIEHISNDAFRNLEQLEDISLSNNKLQHINPDIFKFNNVLSIIDISSNNLQNLPISLFQNMYNLKNVSCCNCSLDSIHKDIFQNSTNLAWLVLTHNNIQTLHPDTFKNLNFLEVLDLGKNNISHFTGSLFVNHPYLKYVNMTENRISELNLHMFVGARNVRYLDFSKNQIISNLTDAYLKNFTDLEIFSLQHNMIVSVELGITEPVKVRNLDISYNIITEFNVIWKNLVYIEIFKVNNNFLRDIDLPPCIPSVKQTLTFLFQYNRISKIKMDALLFDENRVKTDRTMTCFFNGLARNYVDITHNPLLCDCKIYSFYNYIHGKSPRRYQVEIFVDKDNIICDKPYTFENQSLISLRDDMLSCPITEDCPKSCHCGIRGKDNYVFVNCSSRGLEDVPQTVPVDTTVLYFNKNKLKSVLTLNNDTWCNLIELHLDYNLLSNLDNWKFPVTLRYLSIKGNQLKTLPNTLTYFISNLTDFQLYLGNNIFTCDCAIKPLKDFLRENINFVKDNDNILCNITNNNTIEFIPLTSILDSVLCSQDIGSVNQMKFVIILCVLFSVLIVVMLIYYRQRQLILSYFYVHCRSMYDMFYSYSVEDDAIFDAFVAYSSSDRDIVMQLLEELENHPPFFQFCIHERNWLPGCFITDNIANSVECSRRTIIVLSSTFISSPWFNVELRAAVFKMAQDTMNRIIVILKDKTVSLDSIDPELRYVVMNRTYLEWGERWFWEKLKYALPRKKTTNAKLNNNRSASNISEVALIPCKFGDENFSN